MPEQPDSLPPDRPEMPEDDPFATANFADQRQSDEAQTTSDALPVDSESSVPDGTSSTQATQTEDEGAEIYDVQADGRITYSQRSTQNPTITVETEAVRSLDDLTLAELVGQLAAAPRRTWSALWQVLQPDNTRTAVSTVPVPVPAPTIETPQAAATAEGDSPSPTEDADSRKDLPERANRLIGNVDLLQLGLFVTAFLLAIWGGAVLIGGDRRSEAEGLAAGAPFLLAAFGVWGLSEIAGSSGVLLRGWRQATRLGRVFAVLRAASVVLVVRGVIGLWNAATVDLDIVLTYVAPGVQVILLGVGLWLLLDLLRWSLGDLARREAAWLPDWIARDALHDKEQIDLRHPARETVSLSTLTMPWWGARLVLFATGIGLAIITYFDAGANNLSTVGFITWFVSTALVALALTPPDFNFNPLNFNPLRWLRRQGERLRAVDWGAQTPVILALVVIMAFAVVFRTHHLLGDPTQATAIPPEMTSDHVEKILDGIRVSDGARTVFFANNGGREPFQMYALALFGQVSGLGVNFTSLKLLAVLESLITIPVMFWLGRAVVGPHDRRFGVIFGLILAALVAASYWHVTITRLSLRIVLTPLVTALLIIYLTRAMRHNTRSDFIMAGLILGFGLYTYQAVRMLPVVVVMAVALAAYFGGRGTRDRLRFGLNLAVLVLVSVVAFVPMGRYTLDNPDEFNRRTVGRLFGDGVVQEPGPEGSIVQRDATAEEMLQAFNENVPQLMRNIRNALLMFNWKGDVGWINGVPNQPVLDVFTGGLLIIGAAAWLALAARTRDPVFWMVPLALLIMLLPSALSIAYPIENPSNTRTSGALPFAYLIATLPLALIARRLTDVITGRRGAIIAGVTACCVILAAFAANTRLYFTQFYDAYVPASLPYSEAGRILQGFAISDGSYGNAFMIAYPFWWDHRALGLAGGLESEWPNGVYNRDAGDDLMRDVDYVPEFMADAFARTDQFRYDPDRDLLFFFAVQDETTADQLAAWFPQGRAIQYPSYQLNDDFMMFRVPALGEAGFRDFLAQTGTDRLQ